MDEGRVLLCNIKYHFLDAIVLAIRTVIYQKCLTTASCPSTGYTTLSLLQIEKDVIEFDT